MKTMSVSVVAVLLLGASAQAASLSYNIATPWLDSSGRHYVGEYLQCPQVTRLTVETEGQLDQAVSLTLKGDGFQPVKLAATGSRRKCFSGIVCATRDTFVDGTDKAISLERTNDGAYPTTNLPGYSQLLVRMKATLGKKIKCVYTLSQIH